VDPDDPNLLCFLRSYGDRSAVVVLNLTGKPQPLSLNLSRYGWGAEMPSVLLTTMREPPADLRHATLDPFAVVILQSDRAPTTSASGSAVSSAHVEK
jgi:Maltogenic Amylase, C-terminal domain